MKRLIVATAAFVLVFAASSCVQPPRAEQKPGQPDVGSVTPASPEELAKLYGRLLDELLPGLGASDLLAREKPQQELERVCFEVGRPGAEAERRALCVAMIDRLGPETPPPARVWMLRQLERISGEESVAKLAELLNDPDATVRETARRALQNNSAGSANEVLRAALRDAHDTPWRVALVNALGARHEVASAPLLTSLTDDADPAVRSAAIAGLGELGGPRATEWLMLVWMSNNDQGVRKQAAEALLRTADGLVAGGEHERAASIYWTLYRSGPFASVHAAVVRGLALAQPQRAIPLLLSCIHDGSEPQLPLQAARLLGEIPGEAATQALLQELPTAPPAVKVVLLDALTERGDRAARPAVIAALSAGDEQVRIACLRTLQVLGDDTDVVLVGSVAGRSGGPVHDAARKCLARLRGTDVDAAILAAIGQPQIGSTRGELIRSLADRHCKSALATLWETTRDRDEDVRQASFETIGKLAATSDVERLVGLLADETGDTARQAAEDAVVALAGQLPDKELRSASVLSSMEKSPPAVKASLIRVLGRLPSAGALAAIRAALHDPDAAVADAAIRALSGWETAEVQDDLLAVARSGEKENHRVLALRGYIRLLRLPNDRPAEKTLSLLQDAMTLATHTEEQKQVLAALGDVIHPDALKLAQSYLDKEGLRDEAAAAMATIARGVAGRQKDAALAALNDVLAAPVSEEAKRSAKETLEFIVKFDGYIGQWVMSGPFSREGQSFEENFAQVFAPETGPDDAIAWQPLTASRPSHPWMFDLTKAASCTNCCVYVRAQVYSPSQQAARLEVGSDDGVKVWLNGELVHSKPARRGLTVGEDKVNVTLKQGWNVVLLKVVQGDGGWGFACGVRGVDGQALEGLKFEAK